LWTITGERRIDLSRSESPTVALIREIGWGSMLIVVPRLIRRFVMDRPFSELPAATTERERLSRKQALPAILLYRVLKARYGQQRSLIIMRRVVKAGAIQFLSQTLGDLDPAAFQALDSNGQHTAVNGWLERFFTATVELDTVSNDQVSWHVTHCALVRLSVAAGHGELAPTFCAGDAHFFATRTPPLDLQRPTTIADGGNCCPFQLTMRNESNGD
jgi:hypothetical protein